MKVEVLSGVWWVTLVESRHPAAKRLATHSSADFTFHTLAGKVKLAFSLSVLPHQLWWNVTQTMNYCRNTTVSAVHLLGNLIKSMMLPEEMQEFLKVMGKLWNVWGIIFNISSQLIAINYTSTETGKAEPVYLSIILTDLFPKLARGCWNGTHSIHCHTLGNLESPIDLNM